MAYNTIDLGGLYRFSEEWQMGVMIKNLVGFALKDEYRDFELPRYYTLGVAWRPSGYTLALDSEWIWGSFGGLEKKTVEIWLLRAGFEKAITPRLTGRLGLICPVTARTSTLGNLRDDIPSPKLGPTLGLGYAYENWHLDISLYGDPALSYIKQRAAVAAALSLTYQF